MAKTITKIGPKHQVTIPKKIFEELNLEVGDYLEVNTEKDHISMIPKKLVPKDQAWFWTPEWQKKEREADEDIKAGRVSGPFHSANELIKHLKSDENS